MNHERYGPSVACGRSSRATRSVLTLGVLAGLLTVAPAEHVAGQVPTCKGEPATIVGTPGDDHITGTDRADVIVGLGGDDVIDGLTHRDVVCGNGGDDLIMASSGRGARYYGGRGSDTIDYSSTRTTLTVDLSRGRSEVHGELQHRLRGIENIVGSRQSDTLIDNRRGNTIHGGRGYDSIEDGRGRDRLFGEQGKDWIEPGPGRDLADGGTGADYLSYQHAPAAVVVDLRAETATGGDGHDTIIGFEKVVGSRFDDVLRGNAKLNVLSGGDGNDWLSGRGGDYDFLFGNDGFDWADGGPGSYDNCAPDVEVGVNCERSAWQ